MLLYFVKQNHKLLKKLEGHLFRIHQHKIRDHGSIPQKNLLSLYEDLKQQFLQLK